MLSKVKGDLAVANAIHYYITNGYEVCLPIGDKKPYDFIIEFDGLIKRVQVKYGGFYNGVKQYKVALRITGGNKSQNSAKKYSVNDFDELFVFLENGRKFLLPWKDIIPRNEINIENIKYAKYEVK